MQKLDVALVSSVAFIGFSFLPIWSMGVRKRLTFWEFVFGHTIFDHRPVTYVPEEKYTRPLTEAEMNKLCLIQEAERILRRTQQ